MLQKLRNLIFNLLKIRFRLRKINTRSTTTVDTPLYEGEQEDSLLELSCSFHTVYQSRIISDMKKYDLFYLQG